jgi:hypothetical protein
MASFSSNSIKADISWGYDTITTESQSLSLRIIHSAAYGWFYGILLKQKMTQTFLTPPTMALEARIGFSVLS